MPSRLSWSPLGIYKSQIIIFIWSERKTLYKQLDVCRWSWGRRIFILPISAVTDFVSPLAFNTLFTAPFLNQGAHLALQIKRLSLSFTASHPQVILFPSTTIDASSNFSYLGRRLFKVLPPSSGTNKWGILLHACPFHLSSTSRSSGFTNSHLSILRKVFTWPHCYSFFQSMSVCFIFVTDVSLCCFPSSLWSSPLKHGLHPTHLLKKLFQKAPSLLSNTMTNAVSLTFLQFLTLFTVFPSRNAVLLCL